MVHEAERQWNQDTLVNIMWHASPPTVAEPCDWETDIHSHLSDRQWTDLITEGGGLNKAYSPSLRKRNVQAQG
jgi:hypothetical protein